jgi:ketosteroid isomerase-like protein
VELTWRAWSNLFRQIIERGFNRGDLSVADEICSDALIEHEYLAPNARGADILKGQIAATRSGVEGLQLSIEEYVESGDKIWVRMRARGKEVQSGKPVNFYVFDVCRFKDGRLIELRFCIKQERCRQSLGHRFPPLSKNDALSRLPS